MATEPRDARAEAGVLRSGTGMRVDPTGSRGRRAPRQLARRALCDPHVEALCVTVVPCSGRLGLAARAGVTGLDACDPAEATRAGYRQLPHP